METLLATAPCPRSIAPHFSFSILKKTPMSVCENKEQSARKGFARIMRFRAKR